MSHQHVQQRNLQVGTLFALADESGMESAMKQNILTQLVQQHKLKVFTDPAASPTGFPFKVLELEDDGPPTSSSIKMLSELLELEDDGPITTSSMKTLSDPAVYNARPRVCNLGYLRTPYIQPDGKVGYRCPSEDVKDYVAKGGEKSATVGRKCLCNALCADAGFPQVRHITNPVTGEKDLYVEPTLVTTGDDVNQCAQLIKRNRMDGTWGYSASDVVDYLLSDWKKSQRKAEKGRARVNPNRWGYSSIDVAEYLLDGFEEFERQTKGVPELMLL